jgi:hypothetical protein
MNEKSQTYSASEIHRAAANMRASTPVVLKVDGKYLAIAKILHVALTGGPVLVLEAGEKWDSHPRPVPSVEPMDDVPASPDLPNENGKDVV